MSNTHFGGTFSGVRKNGIYNTVLASNLFTSNLEVAQPSTYGPTGPSGLLNTTIISNNTSTGSYEVNTSGFYQSDNFTGSNPIGPRFKNIGYIQSNTGTNFCITVGGVKNYTYITGNFTSINGISLKNIAVWNGFNWSGLGNGLDGPGQSIAFDSMNNLYVTGNFTGSNYIAKWDGSNWSSLGNGLNGVGKSVAVDSLDNVYVTGSFSNAGTTGANSIAKWDGSTWSSLGNGLSNGLMGTGNSLAIDSLDNVYVTGYFTNSGTTFANSIAKWDGAGWNILGSGITGTGYSLAIDSLDNIYVAGDFTTPANYIAKWNGSTWSSLGLGLNDIGISLTIDLVSNDVYVIGDFTTPFNYIAKWDGSNWYSLPNSNNYITYPNNACVYYDYIGDLLIFDNSSVYNFTDKYINLTNESSVIIKTLYSDNAVIVFVSNEISYVFEPSATFL